MLNPNLKKVGLGLMSILVLSLFHCHPPKGNEQLSFTSKNARKTIKSPIVYPYAYGDEIRLESFTVQGLSLTLRVAELVRAMGQPDSILIPGNYCSKKDRIFRQYCYNSLTFMASGDLNRVGAAPRVEQGVIQQIKFDKKSIRMNYRGKSLDCQTSYDELSALFPQTRQFLEADGAAFLRLPLSVKANGGSVGFFFQDGRLARFEYQPPCN